MPAVTRFFIKTSFLYLIAALLVGVILAANFLWELGGILRGVTPLYFHMFMVGWVTQLIFGVVFWMFPRHTPDAPRGSEKLGWWTYGLLNVGLLLRVVGEPMVAQQPGTAWGWLLVVSAVLQWGAALCFFLNTWPRVKPGPRHRRQEAKRGSPLAHLRDWLNNRM